MLAKNPSQRPQTPKEVAGALLPFAKGEIPAKAGQSGTLLGRLSVFQLTRGGGPTTQPDDPDTDTAEATF